MSNTLVEKFLNCVDLDPHDNDNVKESFYSRLSQHATDVRGIDSGQELYTYLMWQLVEKKQPISIGVFKKSNDLCLRIAVDGYEDCCFNYDNLESEFWDFLRYAQLFWEDMKELAEDYDFDDFEEVVDFVDTVHE